MRYVVMLLLLFTVSPGHLQSATAVPVEDMPGSQDHPLVKRYEGSAIVDHEHAGFDEITLPLSELKPSCRSPTTVLRTTCLRAAVGS